MTRQRRYFVAPLSVALIIDTKLARPPTPALQAASGAESRLSERLSLLALAGAHFTLLYQACNVAAVRAGVTRSVGTQWDSLLPFLPGMWLPYLSLTPMLVLAFLTTSRRADLQALTLRLLLATALAALVFAAWPLHMGAPRPEPANAALAALQRALAALDAPHNQLPSLHVAFSVIVAPTLGARLSRVGRAALWAWLAIVAASTLFTRQHHLADVGTGLLLGAGLCATVPPRRRASVVALCYVAAAASALALGLTMWPAWLGLWLAACCLGVAWAYARGDAGFLQKHAGQFPIWVRLVYAPYLVGYWLTWRCVRWRERRGTAVAAVAPGLSVGRRLDAREVMQLPAEVAVIDLAAELAATPGLRGRITHSAAWLDLLTPTSEQLDGVIKAIEAQHALGRPVFVHCSMGYLRSRAVAEAWAIRQAPTAGRPIDGSMPDPHLGTSRHA